MAADHVTGTHVCFIRGLKRFSLKQCYSYHLAHFCCKRTAVEAFTLVTQHSLSKVKCVMNSIAADPLRDTGAQMSIISRDWIAGNLPTAENHSIDDLINKKGVGTEIPYDGWVL